MDEDIRDCPNLNADKKHCDAKETKCAYRMNEKAKETYTKRTKWYEKYYK